ncbi:hypothetical protein JNUCC0626_18155 [Lentzea sp. JNUCC 0626]|uniref:hypothetical protein n=1 Tax=Lentzea sp. JNUCC 0626 TaxID=3367513 RepID=UPI0037492B22
MSADQNGTVQQPQDGTKPESEAPKADETPKSVEEQLAELTSKFDDLKTNARKWETRAKENKDAAKELADLKAQGMTPDQKHQAAEDRAEQAERELARYKVAAETGVPAHLLAGDDEDAMREHAKALKEFKGEQPRNPAPKPDPSQGGSGGKQKASAADEGRAEAQRRFGTKN